MLRYLFYHCVVNTDKYIYIYIYIGTFHLMSCGTVTFKLDTVASYKCYLQPLSPNSPGTSRSCDDYHVTARCRRYYYYYYLFFNPR